MGTVLVLIVVGISLLLVETILPGLIAGIVGVICLGAGVVVGYIQFGPTTGTWILVAVGLGGLVLLGVYVKKFPTSRVARKFVSERAIGGLGAEKPELLHQTGVAHTNLRPSGTALINGLRVDVVTEGSMVQRGTPVKVIAIEGLRVVVRAT